MNNQFYISEKYNLLIYETKDHCESAYKLEQSVASGFQIISAANGVANYLSKKLQIKIFVSTTNEPIFVLEKTENYWNVIIGEKVGWIAVHDKLKIKPLKEVANK